jgi:hypothetical protein
VQLRLADADRIPGSTGLRPSIERKLVCTGNALPKRAIDGSLRGIVRKSRIAPANAISEDSMVV